MISKTFASLPIKIRMILILGLMVLVQTGALGWFAVHFLTQSLNEQMGERALNVARTTASIPEVSTAIRDGDLSYLQIISDRVSKQTQATFVVIGDQQEIRLAHPNTAKVGKSMADDDNDENTIVLKQGLDYITENIGSLGPSIRGKTPIRDDNNEIIGLVSVGYSLNQVNQVVSQYRLTLISTVFLAFIFSLLTATWFANHFKRAIFGLEPEQISRLYEERNVTVESVREGIIAINKLGKIITFNQNAINMLGLEKGSELIGVYIDDILPESNLRQVLESGQPEYDQDIIINNRELIANRIPILQDENITGVVTSFRNKDELEQLSLELNQSKQHIDSLRSQAHEYSNKLHMIAGLIQIDAKEEALEVIGQEVNEHQNLLELLFKQVPDPLISGLIIGKYNRGKELNIKLEIDPESSLQDFPEHLSRNAIVSIVGNIIDNAFEAISEQNPPHKVVKLAILDSGNDLVFEIEDNGSGIADEAIEKLFERGYTTKSSNQQTRGYGLHLSKQLLDKLGGEITFGQVSPNGTRVTIYIPKQT